MDSNLNYIYLLAILAAAGLDVASSLLLNKSDGFKHKSMGFASIALILLAFSCLAFASHGISLPVAYAMWGAFGILGTSVAGWVLLGQKIKAQAWLGMLCLITGISILHLS